jgi:hypothetical protein
MGLSEEDVDYLLALWRLGNVLYDLRLKEMMVSEFLTQDDPVLR